MQPVLVYQIMGSSSSDAESGRGIMPNLTRHVRMLQGDINDKKYKSERWNDMSIQFTQGDYTKLILSQKA